jgi:hypothetical protein
MKSDRLTLIAGLSLLLPAVIRLLSALFSGQVETSIFYPLPGLVFWPAFLLGPAAVAVPLVLFFVWNPGLFYGDTKIPKRSYVLLLATTVLSALWFAVCWKDGIIVQGPRYNYSVSAINVVWISVLWVIFGRNRKAESSFKVNLLVHWLLFAWLAWYAFPFFGEIT